jgi:hypothetical protein
MAFSMIPNYNRHGPDLGIPIDSDAVAAHLRTNLMALGVEDYLIRGLQGHVAVYTMVNDAGLHGRELAAAFGFVASEAACRESAGISLLLMHIVAGCAGHTYGPRDRGPKAAAA